MAWSMEVCHLGVGQGLAVYVEVIHETGRCLALFDLGSISNAGVYGPALETLAAAVRDNDGRIDYVHISHFDRDHCNLFCELAKRYGATKITIEKFVYGAVGSRFRQERYAERWLHQYDILDSVFCEGDAFYRNESPYAASGCDTDINFAIGDSLYFRINTLLFHANLMPEYLSAKSGGIAGTLINSGSSIVVAAIVGEEPDGSYQPYATFISTGDATRSTMEVVLEKCRPKFGDEEKVMTISHHGAKVHVADADGSFETLEEFLSTVKPSESCVSAKCTRRKGWIHPHKDTIGIYNRYCRHDAAGHCVTAFEWDTHRHCVIVAQNIQNDAVYSTYVLTNAQTGDEYNSNTPFWEMNHISKTMTGE